MEPYLSTPFPFSGAIRYTPARRNHYMSDSDEIQFKFRIEKSLYDRLERLAKRCGLGTANKFARWALDEYAELLAELIIKDREERTKRLERHHEELLGKKSQDAPRRR